ncbi:MAG: PadR family transcriptional regulator [Parasphingorhabdus sp.]|uniref:PadR family transcriptional regulator n=2 Tax=Parasphingorhabdus sp. TaxID=2709688 RepID=UPI0032657CDA
MARRRNISKQTRLVLLMLAEAPQTWRYGYEITKMLNIKSGALYPILIRLSEQDYLESEWRDSEKPGLPPRHVYRLSAAGTALARHQANDASLDPLVLPIGAAV